MGGIKMCNVTHNGMNKEFCHGEGDTNKTGYRTLLAMHHFLCSRCF